MARKKKVARGKGQFGAGRSGSPMGQDGAGAARKKKKRGGRR